MVISSATFHQTSDGKKFSFDQGNPQQRIDKRLEADRYERDKLAELGISPDEWSRQMRDASTDSRTAAEKAVEWQPKPRRIETNAEKQLALAEQRVEGSRDRFAGMSSEERQAAILGDIVDREGAQDQEAIAVSKHHAKHAEALEQLHQWQEIERWNSNADQKVRVLIDRAQEQLSHPDNCPRAAQGLINQVAEVFEQRRFNTVARLSQEREQLEAKMVANSTATEAVTVDTEGEVSV